MKQSERRGECEASAGESSESGAEGYVAMRLDVTGGTSSGFAGGSASEGVVQDEGGRETDARAPPDASTTRHAATNSAICRELSTTAAAAVAFADKTDSSLIDPTPSPPSRHASTYLYLLSIVSPEQVHRSLF